MSFDFIDFCIYGSIALGLAAMLIPFVCLLRREKRPSARPAVWSLSLCALSITLQVWCIRYLVLVIEDFSSLIDTINVLAYVCLILLCIVVLLNVLLALAQRRQARDRQ